MAMTGSTSYGNQWQQPINGILEFHLLTKNKLNLLEIRNLNKHLCWQSNIHITNIIWVNY